MTSDIMNPVITTCAPTCFEAAATCTTEDAPKTNPAPADPFAPIIGYEGIKAELRQIADVLAHGEYYGPLGVKPPQGLLIYGSPGIGKTLMATCLVNASGRPTFTCRRSEDQEQFLEKLNRTFENAVAAAPSIVFLDDMDKFANDDEDHRNSEEFVAVQSHIDGLKHKDVFVLATVNNMRQLPRSLHRLGRFDRTIRITPPPLEDAVQILKHYLQDKKHVEDIDVESIAGLLENRSCAALETAIREGAILAGYERSECITTTHIIHAILKSIHRVHPPTHKAPEDLNSGSPEAMKIWRHAGHTAMAEILEPGSVALVTTWESTKKSGGFTLANYRPDQDPMQKVENRILRHLAGYAAVEMITGKLSLGAQRSLEKVREDIGCLVGGSNFGSFLMMEPDFSESEQWKRDSETATAVLMEKYYRDAKQLMRENRVLVEAVAGELAEKGILTKGNIRTIKERVL